MIQFTSSATPGIICASVKLERDTLRRWSAIREVRDTVCRESTARSDVFMLRSATLSPRKPGVSMVASRWAILFSFLSRLARISPVAMCLLALTVGACSRPTPPTPTIGQAQRAGCWLPQSVEKGAGCAGARTDVVPHPSGVALARLRRVHVDPERLGPGAVFRPSEPRIVRVPLLGQLRGGRHAPGGTARTPGACPSAW